MVINDVVIKRRFEIMETEIKNAVHAAGKEARYDEKAKRLLGNRIILAHILVRTVAEFRGMDPKDVMALHRLLRTLFSEHMEAGEKLNIMETEYGIPADDNLRKDVGAMCNLSEGILEKGIAKGMAKGRIEGEKKIILNMYKNNFTLEQIALAADKSVEEIESIIETSEPVPV